MINLIVGALDVPSRCLSTNILGPGEKLRVEESADGLVVGPQGEQASRESKKRAYLMPSQSETRDIEGRIL